MNNCDKTVWDVLDKCDDKVNMKPQVVSSYMHITCFFFFFPSRKSIFRTHTSQYAIRICSRCVFVFMCSRLHAPLAVRSALLHHSINK